MARSHLENSDRLQALHDSALLDSPAEEAFDRITRLAQRLLSAPVALVSLVDDKRQFFKSAQGLTGPVAEARETPLSHSFCQHVVVTGKKLVVENAPEHSLVCDNLAIRDLGVIAYLGVPILSAQGERLGSFCAIDIVARQWTDEEVASLEDLGHMVNNEIALRTANRESAESLKRLTTLADSAPIGIFHANRRGQLTFANPRWLDIVGISNDAARDGQWVDRIHPDDRDNVLDGWRHTLKTGEPFQQEHRYVRSTGEVSWVINRASIGKDDTDELIGTVEEITSAKKTEERLRQALGEVSHLRSAFDQHAIVVITDVRGTITDVNQKFCEISGYNREELLGQNHRMINSGAHPLAFFETMWSTIAKGDTWHGEIRNRAKDGSYYWVETTIVPVLNTDGKPHRYIAIRTDITALKRAQAELAESLVQVRSLTAALDEHSIVAVTDQRGTITDVNDKFCKISGYDREELVGKNHRIINSGAHDQAFFTTMWKTISAGETWHGEIRNRAKDGSHYWVDTTIVPVLGPTGKPKQYIAIRTDISEQRRLLELLSDSQSLAAVGGWELVVPTGQLKCTSQTREIFETPADSDCGFEDMVERFAPGSRERFLAAIADARDAGIAFDLELEIQFWEKPRRWIRTTGKPDLTDDKGAYRIAGSIQDIDAMKRAQLQLSASEVRFRTLAAVLPVGIWEVDAKGQCNYTNEAWQRDTELSLEQSLGWGYTDAVHPDDREALLEAWQDAVATSVPFQHEFRFLTPSGKIRWMHTIGTAVKRGDEVIGYVGVNQDFTERRRYLELLRNTQELASIGGWEYLVAEDRLSWTDETYHIHQLSPDTPMDIEKGIEFYHPDCRAEIAQAVKDGSETGEAWDLELRIITAKGNERWVRAVGKAEIEHGQPVRLSGTFQDIDDAKRAQLALTASEQRFRTLAEVLPVGIFEANAEGQSIFNNTRWLEIAGLSYDEALGDGWAKGIHPDDRERVFAEWHRCAIAQSNYEAEFRFQRPSGETRWVHSVATPLRRDAQIVGWVGANEDITERRASHEALATSEARFRNLAAMMPLGIYETDTQGNCVYTNEAWQKIAGLTAEKSLGDGWITAIHPEDKEEVFAKWTESAHARKPFDHEFRFLSPEGRERWVHSIANAIQSEEGVTIGYVGVNEDITDRRLAVEELAASLSEKETLLREVHHRVKNNLQLISSLLNLQAGYIEDKAALDIFRESQGRVRSMAMIHEMLYAHTSLARINAAEYLSHLTSAVLRSHTDTSRKIQLVEQLEPVELTPDKAIPLGLITNELVTNAVKYGSNTNATLHLKLGLEKTPKNGIVFTISDDGPGFPADFDPTKAKSLGFRLINLLSRQLRAQMDLPQPGGAARYRLELSLESDKE